MEGSIISPVTSTVMFSSLGPVWFVVVIVMLYIPMLEGVALNEKNSCVRFITSPSACHDMVWVVFVEFVKLWGNGDVVWFEFGVNVNVLGSVMFTSVMFDVSSAPEFATDMLNGDSAPFVIKISESLVTSTETF